MNPMGTSEGADPRRDNGVGLAAEIKPHYSKFGYSFQSFCCISHVRGDFPWSPYWGGSKRDIRGGIAVK